jgi:L-ascorbate metabolism protein UlaG (beta-lactamase superfamily)
LPLRQPVRYHQEVARYLRWSTAMTRFFTALAAGLLLVSTAAAADAKVKIRWHGQSFFEIESSKGTRVVLDPHGIEAYGRPDVTADIVLISHEHNDHTQFEVLKGTPKKVIHGLKVSGKRVDWVPIDEKFNDVHIRSVGTYHDNAEGMEKGKNTVFIIEVDGVRIVHLGDLGHLLSPKLIREIGEVDVLMIPVGGVYTINGSEAKDVVKQLKPRQYIVPMHYGTKVFDDLLSAEEFLDEQKSKEEYPSNELIVDPKFKPVEPIIAILKWKGSKE